MRRKPFAIPAVFSAVALLVAACVSGPSSNRPWTTDELVAEAASEAEDILYEDPGRTVAVYYFAAAESLDQAASNELSQYLINALTTEIANDASDAARVVSRQALDQILNELSFQTTDLADKDTQVRIGKQLGADLIITGFLSPGEHDGALKLNMQVIEVSTGVVRGGMIGEFLPPATLGARIAAASASPSADGSASAGGTASADGTATGTTTEVPAPRTYPTIQGSTTTTTVFDDFESGIAEVGLEHFEELYGSRGISHTGSIELATGSGEEFGATAQAATTASAATNASNTGTYLSYRFSARFTPADSLESWERDGGGTAYLSVDPGQPAGSFRGVAFRARLNAQVPVTLSLRQRHGDDVASVSASFSLNPDEWETMLIPFASFVPDGSGAVFDPKAPFSLQFSIPLVDPVDGPDAGKVDAALLLDDIGFFRENGTTAAGVIEGFEDEITRFPLTADVYGSDVFVDYSESDAGVLVRNPVVTSTTVSLSRFGDGPRGRYQRVLVSLVLDPSKAGSVRDYPIALHLNGTASADLAHASALTMLVRSSVPATGSVALHDPAHEASYYGPDFSAGRSWTRIRIPFDELSGDGGTLAAADPKPGTFGIELTFSVDGSALSTAVSSGTVVFSVDLDELLVQ